MKNLWLSLACICTLLLCTQLRAQDGIEIRKEKHRQQVREKAKCIPKLYLFKVDLVALARHDYNIGLERNIGERFSFGLNATYINRSIREFNEAELAKNKQFGFTISPELRHYFLKFGKKNTVLNGTYYAPFLEYERRSKKYLSYNTNLADIIYDKQLNENNVAVGVRLGMQRHLWKGLFFDISASPALQTNKAVYQTREVDVMTGMVPKTQENAKFYELKTVSSQKMAVNYTLKIGFAF